MQRNILVQMVKLAAMQKTAQMVAVQITARMEKAAWMVTVQQMVAAMVAVQMTVWMEKAAWMVTMQQQIAAMQ